MIAPSDLERHLAKAVSPSAAERRRFLPGLTRRDRTAATDRRGTDAPIVLRPAGDGDITVLEQLIQLDGRSLPAGTTRILAESRGRVLAAADVASGQTVSDPFVPTASAVALLRLRAAQLR